MKHEINSDIVSKYGYAVVTDSDKTICCKPECVYMFQDLLEECAEDIPPYKEDFSFVRRGDIISLYLGDFYLLSLSVDELMLVLKTLNINKE